jgi:hypothetical protein
VLLIKVKLRETAVPIMKIAPLTLKSKKLHS